MSTGHTRKTLEVISHPHCGPLRGSEHKQVPGRQRTAGCNLDASVTCDLRDEPGQAVQLPGSVASQVPILSGEPLFPEATLRIQNAVDSKTLKPSVHSIS